MIPFRHPGTGAALVRDGDRLRDVAGTVEVPVVDGIPRFVSVEDDYATSFGFQWLRWADTVSDSRGLEGAKREMIMARSHLDEYDLAGQSVLECGCGGGDDTEVLLTLPFGEVHAFDLSRAVERARRNDDERLVLSQASIFDIPYADGAFDVVYCHRVIQHTPDPTAALRSVARKVRPGGLLFVHSYRRSWRYLMTYKYKYRWLTKRLPHETLTGLLDRHGSRLHELHRRTMTGPRWARIVALNVVPFERLHPVPGATPQRSEYHDLSPDHLLEAAKLATFDALTPAYDKPMAPATFRGILEAEGFVLEHITDREGMPLLATARRRG